MDDNKLLMIVLAFILGLMASKMMKNMCGGRLVEGAMNKMKQIGEVCDTSWDCDSVCCKSDTFSFFDDSPNRCKHAIDCE